MAWSTPDISKITDSLHDLLKSALADAMGPSPKIPPFNVTVSLASPETARLQPPCQLSLYLMHVGRDPYWRNTPVSGPRPQLNEAQPLSLNLYYLLTAWADADYTSEQQAMTIALQAFHSQPIYRLPLTNDEFSITVEADTIEEMSRLWQAFTVAMRLSCVVKVGVVFVAPAVAPPPVAPPPVTANLAVGPIPSASDPPVLYAAMNLAFAPYPPPTDPTTEVVSGGELVVVGGAGTDANLLVRGAGLAPAADIQVLLSTPDGAKVSDVTSWRAPFADQSDPTGSATLQLTLPKVYAPGWIGALVNRLPTPGDYRLTVVRATPGGPQRSNAIPLLVAARIDSLTGPTGAGIYTLKGAGFAAAATTISVGGFDVTPSATVTAGTITFSSSGLSLAPGVYPIGVVVNGVPCLPGPTLSVSAQITGVIAPAAIVPGALYTLEGTGFAPGATTVSLGGLPLTPENTATPGPSGFVVAADGASILLALPDPLPVVGAYPVAVIVDGVPCGAGPTVTIAAQITGLVPPAAVKAGALYVVQGEGFASGPATVTLGALALAPVSAGPPAPSTFFVAADGNSITFALPKPLPAHGHYAIGISINGVPCAGAYAVTI